VKNAATGEKTSAHIFVKLPGQDEWYYGTDADLSYISVGEGELTYMLKPSNTLIYDNGVLTFTDYPPTYLTYQVVHSIPPTPTNFYLGVANDSTIPYLAWGDSPSIRDSFYSRPQIRV